MFVAKVGISESAGGFRIYEVESTQNANIEIPAWKSTPNSGKCLSFGGWVFSSMAARIL